MSAAERTLVVSPHPDDESFGCGATISLFATARVPVSIIILTDGGASHPLHPSVKPEELAIRRRNEAISAVTALGVREESVSFVDLKDGTLADMERTVGNATVDSLSIRIAAISPTVVLVPCRGDGSTEHEAAFRLVLRAIRKAKLDARILEYPVWSLWSPRLLLKPTLRSRRVWRVPIESARGSKHAAIAAYTSQTRPIPPDETAALPVGFAEIFLGSHEFMFEH
jgi:LmbE family N-acetylglucosaminyl deacetylase